jgi:hypothetical protein
MSSGCNQHAGQSSGNKRSMPAKISGCPVVGDPPSAADSAARYLVLARQSLRWSESWIWQQWERWALVSARQALR